MLTMINDIPNNLHTFNKPTMKPFSNVPETLHWLLWNKSVVTNFKLQFTMSDLRNPKENQTRFIQINECGTSNKVPKGDVVVCI